MWSRRARQRPKGAESTARSTTTPPVSGPRQATAPLWPPIQTAYALVHQAAHLLANPDALDGATLRQTYQEQVLRPMGALAPLDGPPAPALAHFVTVTASYWPGLFHCYDVPDLPRTNNDLEQYFGAARHLEPGTARHRTQERVTSPRGAGSGARGRAAGHAAAGPERC